jgi:hypothetical protein
MVLAQKDQLLEIHPGARLGKPILCGRLSVSPRQTRAIDAQSAECRNNRGPHSSQGVRTNLLFTMSCRTRGGPKPAAKLYTNDFSSSQHHSKEWWSRTGSNRRPPACKAGALPAELRPLIPVERNWWAWEDLNLRPHAYQARALTN